MTGKKSYNEDEKTIEGYYKQLDDEGSMEREPFVDSQQRMSSVSNSGAYIPPASMGGGGPSSSY